MENNNIFGYCDPKFARVEEVFRRNFRDGWEFEGAAFAVYYKGKLVVDLNGGYADSTSDRLWTDKTRTVVFSATKAVGAICIAILVDRGYIQYEDKVASFWPEFGQHGKEDITVLHIMNHQAGLPAFSEEITYEEARYNPERIAKIIENSHPLWKPGTQSGYHGITYGWLIDQIIRRVDLKKRSVGVFFQEEIAQKHGIDFHIGLAPEEEYTVARLRASSAWSVVKEIWKTPRIFKIIFIILMAQLFKWGYPQVFTYPKFFNLRKSANNPDMHFLEQAGAMGIGKARDLGKLFNLVLKGEIISKKLLERFYKPMVQGKDCVILMDTNKGHGFLYEPHPKKPGKYMFGHPGFGGSNIRVDPEEDLVITYVCNGLKAAAGDSAYTYRSLRDAVFDSLGKFSKENVVDDTEEDAVDAVMMKIE